MTISNGSSKTRLNRLNITIFGVGAMGTLFGSYLNKVANVTLYGNWPAQIEALRQDGLTVIHPDGHESQHRLSVTNDLAEIVPADVALVLVKSYQTEEVAQKVARVLHPGGVAITLQNGLGNFEKLAQAVGQEQATLGITAQGATVLAPGQLRHAGNGATYLAQLPGRESYLQEINDLFNRAGLMTTTVDNADSLIWGKLAINAGINPLTALLDVPNGALIEDTTWRETMVAAVDEVAQIAAAQGIELPFSDITQRTVEVCQATASNLSSMLQDVKRSAPTEIKAICGMVVEYGKRFNAPTPVNARLLRLITDKEAGREVVLDFGA